MTETVTGPHDVHRPAPIRCFLVLVLVNLMWAFQFSGAKIATERLGPIAVALIPLALSTLLFAPLLRISRGKKPRPRWTPGVWQGQWVSTQANSIIFNRVPIAPPGTMGGNRIFLITNIRADANGLGVVPGSTPLGVVETLTSGNPSILPVSSINASQTIGSVQTGLVVTGGTASTFQQCNNRDFALVNAVTLNKGFASSFRVRSFGSDINNPSTLNPQDAPGVA